MDDQGLVQPLMTGSGTVVLMCDEGGEVWLHPDDINRLAPIIPREPSWTVNDGVHITPGTTRWATRDDLPDDWPDPKD